MNHTPRLKSIIAIFTLTFILINVSYNIDAQIIIYPDNNIKTVNNYSIVNLIETKDGEINAIGKVSDNKFNFLAIGYSKLISNGTIKVACELKNQLQISDLTSAIIQPDGSLSVYGNYIADRGLTSTFISTIDPSKNTITKTIKIDNPLQHTSITSSIGNNEQIVANAMFLPSKSVYNIHLSRNLIANNFVKYSFDIKSNFYEIPAQISLQTDTSFYLLANRFLDQQMTKSIGVIYSISPKLKENWNLQVLNSSGLSKQCLTSNKEGWIYYFCSFKDKNNRKTYSEGYIFDKTGNKLRQIDIDSIYINSVLILKNTNILIVGYKIQKNDKNDVKTATYIIYDRTLKKIIYRSLNKAVKNEYGLKAKSEYIFSGISEFTTSVQLKNAKIILAGSAFDNSGSFNNNNPNSTNLSKYLISILKENGEL